jgi:PhzF family phenazine biosynthesis protein
MRYLHYDVFTSTPFEGNQLAVYPDPPRDIAVERMQRIAAEMNFSETTFVFPPEGTGDVRMRIFTPGTELPLAGHPTIGTTFALAREGVIAPGRESFVFELGVGPIPVSLEWDDHGLSFAWMTQLRPSFGAQIADRDGFAAAVGLQADDLEDLPIEEVSCGVSFLFVPVKTRAAVDRVEISRRDLARVCAQAKSDDLAVFFFTKDRRTAGIVPTPPRHGQRRAGTVDGQPSGRRHEASQPHPHLDRQRRRHDYARPGRRPIGAGGGGNAAGVTCRGFAVRGSRVRGFRGSGRVSFRFGRSPFREEAWAREIRVLTRT